jgi:flagellar basal body rod protein FlgG
MRSLNIAATGMMAQQMNIDVISQNLANQTTSGYKAQRAEFQDLIYQSLERVGTNSSNVGTVLPTGSSKPQALLIGRCKAKAIFRLRCQTAKSLIRVRVLLN